MSDRRPLGDILIESGHIAEPDVARAVEYQRQHGGFFGQALVSLGIVGHGEIDWALASQFDLPYIFPNAEAVDRQAAGLVPAEWALAHLAVPIVRSGRTLTVAVADPLHGEALEQLSVRTGLQIEMALASAGNIRALIHEIYSVQGTSPAVPAHCSFFFAAALAGGASRIGISLRSGQALGWWQAEGDRQRVPLLHGWAQELEAIIVPPPAPQSETAQRPEHWSAVVRLSDREVAVHASALAGAGGIEYLFRPVERLAAPVRTLAMPETITIELRLLAERGQARVAIVSDDSDVARVLLPQLPRLVFGNACRAVHLAPTGTDLPHVMTLTPNGHENWVQQLSEWEFDAITIALPLPDELLAAALNAARLTAVAAAADEESRLRALGVGWVLTVPAGPAGAWGLRAVDR